MGMNEKELTIFLERISATAIANQAVLRCLVNGIPIVPENVILFVGDFVDPTNEEFSGLIDQILLAIEETATAHLLGPHM